jgi:teichuronic acid exporter
VLWQASGSTAAQVLGVAAMPVLTRIYSPSDFAALTLFSQLVMGLAIVMTLRLEYLVMLPATSDEAWSVLRMTGLLGLGHVLVLTPVLYLAPLHWEWVAHQGTISTWLWLLPATAGVVSLAVAFQQIVQRGGDFKSSGLSEFLGRLAYVGCGLFGALALPSIVGLMASTIGNGLVKLAWLMRTAGRRNLAWLEGTRAPISSAIRRLALSTSVSNLISIFSGLAPMVYIGSTYGEAALGQYGLVVSTLYLPSTLLGQSIGQVYYQRASHIHATHQPFSSLLLATTKSLVIIGVPVYTLIALLAPAAYPLIFGANWSDAGSIARFLAFAALASFISTPLDKTSLIVRAWWYLTTWHAVRAAGTLIGLWYASAQQLAFEQCVLLIAAVSATCYLADWGASFGFTSRKPRHAESRNALEKREVP